MLLQEQPAGQITVEEAIERIKKLRSKLSEIQSEIDKVVSEAVEQIRLDYVRQLRELNAGSKDEFESTEEYNRRLTASEQKKRRIHEEQARAENDVRTKFSQETAGIENEIEELLMAEYPVYAKEVSVELGKYDADNKELPVRVEWDSQKGGARGKIDGILEIEGPHAREIKNHKKFLSTKSWVAINPSDLKINLSRLKIIDNTENGLLIPVKIGGGWFIIGGGWIQDLGNGTIMNSETSLQWLQDAGSESMTWYQANDYVKNLYIGGYSDWRIPTKEEIESLIAIATREGTREKYHNFFNEHGFKNVLYGYYWSSTYHTNIADRAYVLASWDGDLLSIDKSRDAYVWPVRSEPFSARTEASREEFPYKDMVSVKSGASSMNESQSIALARGQKIFKANCEVCHGNKGDGRGPASATMNPKPTDFTNSRIMKNIDDLKMNKSIRDGRPGTAMVGFARTLKAKDIEDVIGYIKNSGKTEGTIPLDSQRDDCEFGPGEYRETEIDDRRIEGINGRVEFRPEIVVRVQRSICLDQHLNKACVDSPVASLVGMGQGISGDLSPERG